MINCVGRKTQPRADSVNISMLAPWTDPKPYGPTPFPPHIASCFKKLSKKDSFFWHKISY